MSQQMPRSTVRTSTEQRSRSTSPINSRQLGALFVEVKSKLITLCRPRAAGCRRQTLAADARFFSKHVSTGLMGRALHVALLMLIGVIGLRGRRCRKREGRKKVRWLFKQSPLKNHVHFHRWSRKIQENLNFDAPSSRLHWVAVHALCVFVSCKASCDVGGHESTSDRLEQRKSC